MIKEQSEIVTIKGDWFIFKCLSQENLRVNRAVFGLIWKGILYSTIPVSLVEKYSGCQEKFTIVCNIVIFCNFHFFQHKPATKLTAKPKKAMANTATKKTPKKSAKKLSSFLLLLTYALPRAIKWSQKELTFTSSSFFACSNKTKQRSNDLFMQNNPIYCIESIWL